MGGESVGALDIKNEAIRWELLATPHLDDIPWLDVSPSDWLEPLELGGNHQKFEHLVINLIRDLSLSKLKSHISYSHQSDVHREGHNWERGTHVIVFL